MEKAHTPSEASHSSLSNDSLAPVPKEGQTWGWFEIFNIWANAIQSLFGYSLVASLFISVLSGYAWLIGAFIGGVLYFFLVRNAIQTVKIA